MSAASSNQKRQDPSPPIQVWIGRRNAEVQARRPSPSPAAPPTRNRVTRIGPAAAPPSRASRPQDEALRDVVAGARGARDALTFGTGERLYAGALALGDAAHGADLRRAFAGRMSAEQAQDRYETMHYAAARTAGQFLGTGVQVAALGPAEGLYVGGVRMAEATPLIAREIAVIGGAGGAAGVGGQALSDAARRKLSSIGDYAGAGLGGAVGGLASLGGRAGYAGAAGGAATSLAQDLFNGRALSLDRARGAAVMGGVLGAIGGAAGRRWSDGLDWRTEKGLLGEEFSRLRTWARGDKTLSGKKTAEVLGNQKITIPDLRSVRNGQQREIIESKFGKTAKLSKNQKYAHKTRNDYRVDHSLPKDVGAITGFLPGLFGLHFVPPSNQPSHKSKTGPL